LTTLFLILQLKCEIKIIHGEPGVRPPESSEDCAIVEPVPKAKATYKTSDRLRIVFQLEAEPLREIETKMIVIRESDNAEVRRVEFQSAKPGRRVVSWDLQDENKKVVAPGFYIIKISEIKDLCKDQIRIKVFDLRSLIDLNIAYGKTYSKDSILDDYVNKLLIPVEECLYKRASDNLIKETRSPYDQPCFVLQVTEHLGSTVSKELGNRNSPIRKAADESQKFVDALNDDSELSWEGRTTAVLAQKKKAFNGILAREREIRAEGIASGVPMFTSVPKFTDKDRESIVKECLQPPVNAVAGIFSFLAPSLDEEMKASEKRAQEILEQQK
jgi:hypothetical protein